jgi:hypothetical protein
MASSPVFAATPKFGSATVSATADTGWTSLTNSVALLTSGASGSKVEEVVFQGIGITLAGMVNLVLYDGTNYSLIDQVKFLGISGSTTASAERFVRQYSNLVIPATGGTTYTLRATSMVASQLVRVTAFYADF